MLILSLLIASLLAIASCFVTYQIHEQPTTERLNNRKRIQSWWGIFLLCLIIFYTEFYIGNIALCLFVLGLSIWAIIELSHLHKSRISAFHILLATIIIISYYLATPQLTNPYIAMLLILPILLMLISLITLTHITTTLYITTALSSFILIAQISHSDAYDTALILLYLVSITAFNDILQYITGKLFGKHHFAPTLSPHKTYEGAFGGLCLTSLIGAFTLPTILNISWQQALLIIGSMSICGILGDLYLSYFKRRANVKNTGNSIPGHGGLLDRIDSLLLTAPVFGLSLLLIR